VVETNPLQKLDARTSGHPLVSQKNMDRAARKKLLGLIGTRGGEDVIVRAQQVL
jgi:hypothetical protein